ncbi:hypothetical protein B0H10DRAFT_1959636 [Mycena sp. CBHHK59/15]|nr:hypothetical protein B0H10DRAFT_1959636 [Mycena sp. CBHHK59/15]
MARGTVPFQNPPILNGMMHCLRLVEKIAHRDYGIEKPEFSRLVYLLKHIRHLLRVYYDFLVGKRPHSDLMFYDWEKIFDVGITLHQVRLCLQLHPSGLCAVMAEGGKKLEVFLLDDALNVGEIWMEAIAIEKCVAADVKSEDADHMKASKIDEAAQKDIVAHILSWFYRDVLVAFVFNDSPSGSENVKRWAR